MFSYDNQPKIAVDKQFYQDSMDLSRVILGINIESIRTKAITSQLQFNAFQGLRIRFDLYTGFAGGWPSPVTTSISLHRSIHGPTMYILLKLFYLGLSL